MNYFRSSLILLLLTILPLGQITTEAQSDPLSTDTLALYFDRPMYFEANVGQLATPEDQTPVDFIARGNHYILYLSGGEAYFALQQAGAANGNARSDSLVLRTQLLGSNPNRPAIGVDRQPGASNYFIGNDPNQWRTSVPHYGQVRYESIYAGIDLVYYGNNRQLQYDFIVTPGADPRAIRINFAPVERLELAANGDLLLHTANGVIRQHAPFIYQNRAEGWVAIPGGFALLEDDGIGFALAAYDPSLPLIIDPVVEYSTYIGGSEPDDAWSIAADENGYAYVTGRTESADFPASAGALDGTMGGQSDAFVVKIDTNATGAASLLYATYLGGSGVDNGWGIAVDDSGNAYVTGMTGSVDFPVTPSGFQQLRGQGICCTTDAFMTKLNSTGTALLYSTYIGGGSGEEGYGVTVDSSGHAYVMGSTSSDELLTTANAYLTTNPLGQSRLFVTKIDTLSGMDSLEYSTFFGNGSGGSGPGRGIAADDNGNVYITGGTEATNFPLTANAYQTTLRGGRDAFVVRFDTTQSGAASLVYSSLLGGSDAENFNNAMGALDCDSDGNVYLTGETMSTDFPIVNGFQRVYAGGAADGFVAKINTNASGSASLVYSTYLGGYGFDQGWGIAATRQGNVYITGQTRSANFPLFHPIQSVVVGDLGSFVTKIDTNLSGLASLTYSTYLGRGGNGFGGAAVANGIAYVAGQIAGLVVNYQPEGVPVFPIMNGFQTTYGGKTDGYMARLGFDADLSVDETNFDNLLVVGYETTYTLIQSNSGPETVTGIELQILLPLGMTFVSAVPSQGTCENAGNIIFCELGNLEDDESVTVAITVIVPNPIVELLPTPTQLIAGWPVARARSRQAIIARTWHTVATAAGLQVWRALAASSGTPISSDAAVDGVERDPNSGNNSSTATFQAIEGSVLHFSEEQLYHAIEEEIATNPDIQDIEFVLADVTTAGIDLTVRRTDGSVGQVQVSINNANGFMVIQFQNITVNGSPAPSSFVETIAHELPPLLTASLDELIDQSAAPGYNLVRIMPRSQFLEAIVEE